MKRQYFITLILASFFILTFFHGSNVYAQNSISGDSLCGKWDPVANKIVNPCGVLSFKQMFQAVFKLILAIGVPAIVVIIIYRFVWAWYAVVNGNVGAYKEALKKVTNALVGLIILVAVFSGLIFTMLKYFGAQDWTLRLLKAISVEMVPHAYAATSACSPATKGGTCYFTAKGTKLVGNITDANSAFDKSLFCQDSLTGLTSNTDFANNTNYWKGMTDCTGKINGTVCDRGPDYYNSMGVCSDSYTPPDPRFTTGATDCIGKLPLTLCTTSGVTAVVNGKGGLCTSRNGIVGEATCYPAGTGVKCLSPFTQNPGTTDFGGSPCIVVGDPCKLPNGGTGIYVQKPLNIFCVDPATITSSSSPSPASASNANQNAGAQTQAQEQLLPNPTGFTNFYDFFLSVFAMIMKFFLYPALIGIWVWSGFLYVWAQGAPEKLKQAHNLLFWAVISTLVVFMTNGFLIALQGTVTNILSN